MNSSIRHAALAAFFAFFLSLACTPANTSIVPERDSGQPMGDAGDTGGGTGGGGSAPVDGGTGGASGGGASGGGGGGQSSENFRQGPTGCQALTVQANTDVGGYKSTKYGWNDADCQRRTAALVNNDASDPGGSRGGFLRELTWRQGSQDITARGTGANGWNGWGYVVNHYGNSAALSRNRTGTYRTVLSGKHHAIHEFKLQMQPGGPVDVTVQWFFRTGKSHPIYAITFDATPAGPNTVKADTRAPYGELAFEGSAGAIGGIAWGDKYKFTTTGSGPFTTQSTWDYTAANLVPYVRMWAQTANAEMGAVQTQSWEQHIAGGDYGGGMLASACWGKTSANKGAGCVPAGQTMMQDWLWPFQLNQYELPFTQTSHRLAWGATYGTIGQTSVSAFGKTFSGYPRVSYSVFAVVGPRSTEATPVQVREVERLLASKLTASEGTVAVSGPAGVGRNDTMNYAPAGYDPVWASWNVTAAGNRATVTLEPGQNALQQPLVRVLGFSAPAVSKVTVDGQTLTADQGYFATLDAANQTLWLTLNGTLTGPAVIHVE